MFREQIGRAEGAKIVQPGKTDTGMLSRWAFTEITDASFHWKGAGSADDGKSWHRFVEVLARRHPAAT